MRFTEAQNDRLHAAVRYRGGSIQAFLHAAAIEALSKVEKERQEEEGRVTSRRREDRRGSQGLGVRERMLEATPPKAQHEPPPPPAPVVIAMPAAAPGSDIGRLAAYVVNGPRSDQSVRRRVVDGVLDASSKSTEERAQARRALDEQIAALERNEPQDLFERIKRELLP